MIYFFNKTLWVNKFNCNIHEALGVITEHLYLTTIQFFLNRDHPKPYISVRGFHQIKKQSFKIYGTKRSCLHCFCRLPTSHAPRKQPTSPYRLTQRNIVSRTKIYHFFNSKRKIFKRAQLPHFQKTPSHFFIFILFSSFSSTHFSIPSFLFS